MPAYAQALTSLYADVFFRGKLLSFHVGAGNRPAIIRKHASKPLYVIALATERNGNKKGSAKAAANVIVLVGNTTDGARWPGASDTGSWNITLEARLQGSVYLVDRTSVASPKVVQLDGWHDHRHPYYWPKEVEVEAELVPAAPTQEQPHGGLALERVQTERSSRHDAAMAGPNFAAFTSFVALKGVRRGLEFEAEITTMHSGTRVLDVWVWARVRAPLTKAGGVALRVAIRSIGSNHNHAKAVRKQTWKARPRKTVDVAVAHAAWSWVSVSAALPLPLALPRARFPTSLKLRCELLAVGTNATVDVDKVILSSNADFSPQ